MAHTIAEAGHFIATHVKVDQCAAEHRRGAAIGYRYVQAFRNGERFPDLGCGELTGSGIFVVAGAHYAGIGLEQHDLGLPAIVVGWLCKQMARRE